MNSLGHLSREGGRYGICFSDLGLTVFSSGDATLAALIKAFAAGPLPRLADPRRRAEDQA